MDRPSPAASPQADQDSRPLGPETNRAGRPRPRAALTRIAGRLARFLLITAALAGALVLTPSGAGAQGEGCSDYEWHHYWSECIDELPQSPQPECEREPTPATPDSGMAGWFAEPSRQDKGEGIGTYTAFGYAGYQLPMYGSQELSIRGECIDSLTLPNGADTANALANMEFGVAVATIGASNSMRQAAWEPERMWGWSNDFMETGTRVLYEQVFTVFGAVTVGVIGLYLLWRSRQADMNSAVTTVAWAALILVLVTAVVRWPVQSAGWTDEALKAGLNLSAALIEDESAEGCIRRTDLSNTEYENLKEDNEGNPDFCIDTRTASVIASDTVSNEVLYQNWLRAMLGQGEEYEYQEEGGEVVLDSDGNPVVENANIAYKYGPALFAAQAFSWSDDREADRSSSTRNRLIEDKQTMWRGLAAQIEQEDPEAFAHLKGDRAWERTGTGLLAVLTTLFFALFDITASVLIILGFMIVRFAVVALPIIGTIALLRPAGGPFKRLVNAVLAAVINVAVFSLAAVIYLWATGRILGTTLPTWMQVLLIGLLGVAAWMLLRPYRRATTLIGGGGPADALLGRSSDKEHVKETERRREIVRQKDERPESRSDAGQGGERRRAEERSGPAEPGSSQPPTRSESSPGPASTGGGVYTPPPRRQ